MEQIHWMVMKGGYSYSDIMSIPIFERKYLLTLLNSRLEEEVKLKSTGKVTI